MKKKKHHINFGLKVFFGAFNFEFHHIYMLLLIELSIPAGIWDNKLHGTAAINFKYIEGPCWGRKLNTRLQTNIK